MSDQALAAEPAPLTVRVETAMRMIGLGRTKFYELIGEGEIETIKVGRSTLVIVESLRAFVQSRRSA